MEAVCEDEHFLTTTHLVTWVKFNNPQWLDEYTSSKPSDDRAYKSLIQWCLNFANRHDFRQCVPYALKASQGELSAIQDALSTKLYVKFRHIPKRAWMKFDETPMYFDMFLNLKCDVSKKSCKILEDELFCGANLQPLPANTTSVLHPLDVGVMSPFK
ncbi:hypothetical protein H257_13686 [Aphanomyces astaci]|uniref:DDE-1 domain-containing protein n=1 Tax=Aphanomyces astaci TaxID=112090 RepID=W4FWA5_APHAT|nr:hypothetical protein H257_13686 [Aphanomyces astaci]ETV70948.1 hypothetical protein H257_13686 [Aphanomyces astaci]|eukprot:XP_009839611.1 hypothetical protein H257_13686 [Aphanomyces astaci]